MVHIFPKAQVAANKNAHNFRHHFLAQFFMLFHMVWSILFGVLALKTLKWKFLIGCWRISTNEKVVSQANTPNKMDHSKWKSIKNCARKWCRKFCAFLFEVTWAFGKMCSGCWPVNCLEEELLPYKEMLNNFLTVSALLVLICWAIALCSAICFTFLFV